MGWIDHLVYAAPDLDAACADVERRLGVRASVGGQHIGRGTRNALIEIGPRRYLEIVAPDPAQPNPASARWFGIDALTAPRLVAWSAAGSNLAQLVDAARRRGVLLGDVGAGGRQRADGVAVSWQVTDPTTIVGDGVVPFFIDWGASPHPAETAVHGPRLAELRAEHPDPDRVRVLLAALGLEMRVDHAAQPALIATFDAAPGSIQLR